MRKYCVFVFLYLSCLNLFAQNKVHLICEAASRELYLGKIEGSNNETINVNIIEGEDVKISSIGGRLSFVFHGPSAISIGNELALYKVLDSSSTEKFHIINYEVADSAKNRYQESIDINRYNGEFRYSKFLIGKVIKSEGDCKRAEKKF